MIAMTKITASQIEDIAIVQKELERRRAELGAKVSTITVILTGGLYVFTFFLWLFFFQDYTQLLAYAFTVLAMCLSSACYLLLYRIGKARLGMAVFLITTIVALSLDPLILPGVFPIVGSCLLVASVLGYLLFDTRGGHVISLLCILAFAADVVILQDWDLSIFPTILSAEVNTNLSNAVMFSTFPLLFVMIWFVVSGQDELFRQSRLAENEVAQQMRVVQQQREELETANEEIEARIKAETEQREFLQNLVVHVKEIGNLLDSSSYQIQITSEQSAESTQQVADTIQQIAEGTAQQTENVSNAMSILEQVSQAIDGVAKGAQEQAATIGRSVQLTASISDSTQIVTDNALSGATEAARAAQTARSGTESIRKTLEGMENIREKVGVSAKKVREMGQRSEHIGNIVETIDSIASQTNLLALNATIEAARAGEHGKGFAVVADEVRKLAEKSAESTQEISSLIKDVQQSVVDAIQSMEEGAAEVETEVLRASESGQVLDDILVAVDSVSQQMDDIAIAAQGMSDSVGQMVDMMDTVSAIVEENTASTEEMSASAGEVSQAFDNISIISEENNAATEEVSATTGEVTAQAREVSVLAQELRKMAEELQNAVAAYRT
jgi:methyl-accepting chemotaxis protein